MWKKTLEILEKSINPVHVRAWLTPLGARLDQDGLVLTASNGFVASWIKNRYLEVIEQALRQAANRELPVRVECASQTLCLGNNDRKPGGVFGGVAGGIPDRIHGNVSAIASGEIPQQCTENPLGNLPERQTPNSPETDAVQAAGIISGIGVGRDGRLERSVPQRARQQTAPVPRQHALPLAAPKMRSVAQTRGDGVAGAGNWRFSFQDFVVGPSNELAFSAARSICRQQLVTDQFYICSAPGLGKTHLLQAIGQELSAGDGLKGGRVRLAYLSAEDFACRMVMALKQREMESFKAGFRDGVDVLLLEDIHFLQGKEKTQEELLATVKALRGAGKKVVFTSSFLPKELPKLDSLLASQFCDGFMAVIDKPDFATRMRILEAKARVFQVQIPQDVNELFAGSIHNDIRLLENCLQNLVIKARLMNQHITHGLALEVLRNYAPHNSKPDLEAIIAFICRSFNLSHDSLRTKSRKKQNVLARNTIFYLARKHTDLSLKHIGEAFNRKHSTVIKGITQVERELSRQSPVGRQMDRLVQTLESQSVGSPTLQ
ncbi:DnaA ATPase domain-containing protein [Desulfonatronum thioautotrophicum]|uniref:DnaA ATPase domain-containing protein n=1 Tax=Desulfonatronum thioautotrophicum TaxID=617001 RepID=UPI001ABFC836|nr:DnaA/Hda family protein [Desulfonatronum thioautotrophicum]